MTLVTIGLLLGLTSSFPGIGGGMAGRAMNRSLSDNAVEKLFITLMAVIIGISACNGWQYTFAAGV